MELSGETSLDGGDDDDVPVILFLWLPTLIRSARRPRTFLLAEQVRSSRDDEVLIEFSLLLVVLESSQEDLEEGHESKELPFITLAMTLLLLLFLSLLIVL